LQIFGAIRAVATAGKPGEIFFLSQVNNITISPISSRPNFTKFEHNTSIGVAMKTFKQIFETFTVRGRFSQKRKNFSNILRLATSGSHNSAMITDCRKFTTKIVLDGISTFHFFTVGINAKSFPWSVHSVHGTYSQILRTRRMRVTHGTAQHDNSHVTLVRLECRK